jgi:small-conductance mechanosensitive channel
LIYGFAVIVATFILGILIRRFLKHQRNRLKRKHDQSAEQIETQFIIIERLVIPIVVFLGITAFFMIFERLRGVGATFLASAGVYGLVVGFAAKSTLSNMVAGIMLAFSQPIRVGDVVMMNKEYGRIEDITLMYTYLRVWDNRRLVIPNEIMSNEKIINYSIRDERIWAKIGIYLDYSTDFGHVKKLLMEIAQNSPYIDSEDPPDVWLMDLGKQTLEIWVAAWAKDPVDAWMLRCDIREKTLKKFKELNIPLPRFRLQLEDSRIAEYEGREQQEVFDRRIVEGDIT